MYEYEAPKDDSKNFEQTGDFIRRYLILFPVAGYCLYKMSFVRKNKMSERQEWKLISRPVEHQLGCLLTRRLKQSCQNLCYKQDTEEVMRVQKCIAKLARDNSLLAEVEGIKVVVVHNTSSLAMFMSPDKSFFITVAALSLAKTEEQLALVVAHELSHYLLDHQVKRIFVSWFWRYGVF